MDACSGPANAVLRTETPSMADILAAGAVLVADAVQLLVDALREHGEFVSSVTDDPPPPYTGMTTRAIEAMLAAKAAQPDLRLEAPQRFADTETYSPAGARALAATYRQESDKGAEEVRDQLALARATLGQGGHKIRLALMDVAGCRARRNRQWAQALELAALEVEEEESKAELEVGRSFGRLVRELTEAERMLRSEQDRAKPSAASLYVALWSGDHEIVYPGYARVAIARSPETWTIGPLPDGDEAGAVATNAQEIRFPSCRGGEHRVDGIRLFTAPTGGDEYFAGPYAPFVVLNGDAPLFEPGTITVTAKV